MSPYVAEFLGTAILILMGNGVVANVVLRGTKGNGGGWIVITTGWGLAVFTAVLCVAQFSGAHINPAVSVGVAAAGIDDNFTWTDVPGYVTAQMLGAIFGACLVYLFHQPHYAMTENADAKLATFCNAPAVRGWPLNNIFCEATGTFVLVLAVLLMSDPTFELPGGSGETSVKVGLGSIGALPVGLIVFAIGLSLGGTTGYAINPARDLGPRIAHAFLPIPGKRDSDWGYSWIPVVGPLLGAAAAAILYGLIDTSAV
jgi:glycerol uptake facilitator protein